MGTSSRSRSRSPVTETVGIDRQQDVLVVRYADGDAEHWQIDSASAGEAKKAANSRRTATDAGKLDDCRALQRPDFLFAGLRAAPCWQREAFPKTVAILEGASVAARNEVLDLLESLDEGSTHEGNFASTPPAWQPQREGLHDGMWQKLELWSHGRCHEELRAFTPRLLAAAAACPELMREAPGRVALSLMLPGTSVRPHCGPTNHRLRLHLPLLLPGGATSSNGLCVAGQHLVWQLGRCLVFDDSFEHSVDLPESDLSAPLIELVRVVLIVDLWHPDAERLGLRQQ